MGVGELKFRNDTKNIVKKVKISYNISIGKKESKKGGERYMEKFLIMWIICGIIKVIYMGMYKSRVERKWYIWDILVAIVINVAFYGGCFKIIGWLIGK